MLGPSLFTSPCGLADSGMEELGDAIVGAWDDFLAVAASADLSRPSRLPGWSGREACIHLGSWDDHRVMSSVVAAARSGGGEEPADVDGGNARLNAAHRDASNDDVLAALQRSRDVIEAWFEGAEPAELGLALVRSAVGELPLLALLSAGCYELAVHALDLGPCGADAPSPFLLGRGLAALIDVTGALSARHDIPITVTAQTPDGGWAFTSSADGWTTDAVPPGTYLGTGVRGTAADLLDVSAGRVPLPGLLLTRRLVVQQLPSFMRLAPILSEVPGLPGGSALKAGVGGISAVTGGVSKVLGRLRR
jgi:uncharacterized protein (TIGR03083 family)